LKENPIMINRFRVTRALAALASVGLVAGACAKERPDAYGTFEATEVTLSAEVAGRLLAVHADEGAAVAAGAVIAVVDTAPMALQRGELRARRAAIESRGREADAQLGVVEAQRTVAQREFERTIRLVAASAATSQQADRATRDLKTLEAQAEAVKASRATIAREMASVDAQVAQLDDRIRRARVTAASGGTILSRFVEAGEVVGAGSAIAKMAALDSLTFRAYVAERQLGLVKLGATVQVKVDAPDGTFRTLAGKVTWVSSTAEFTPTPIQTREERVTQVYAVKVTVANADGSLKIGMPGELVLGGAAK
jgi:HlyD family secretion protein